MLFWPVSTADSGGLSSSVRILSQSQEHMTKETQSHACSLHTNITNIQNSFFVHGFRLRAKGKAFREKSLQTRGAHTNFTQKGISLWTGNLLADRQLLTAHHHAVCGLFCTSKMQRAFEGLNTMVMYKTSGSMVWFSGFASDYWYCDCDI